jgi:hypothetical protein
MECNLYELMKDRKKFFPESQARNPPLLLNPKPSTFNPPA